MFGEDNLPHGAYIPLDCIRYIEDNLNPLNRLTYPTQVTAVDGRIFYSMLSAAETQDRTQYIALADRLVENDPEVLTAKMEALRERLREAIP